MNDSLTQAVIAEFDGASFPRDGERLAKAAARASVLGNRELKRLRTRLEVLIQSNGAETATALGTGAALAGFVTAQVPLRDDQREEVRRLGALLILMIVMFDSALDRGQPVPRLFVRGEDVPASDESRLAAVIRHYFSELHELPSLRPEVGSLLWKTLRRLYYAEVESASDASISRSAWWRKNALPFIVMGLPAWAFTSEWDPVLFRAHLLWLGRLGEFFGWLDDVIDREYDACCGHANRAGVRLRNTGEPQFARRLAAMGDRVLADWDRASRSPLTRDVFAMMVWTWIENSPSMRR
jgi:hypothetical protein